ncbi:MAG TPA: hypothetical protein VM287_01585 [Egibacteraceae bacterium]|nr:hypothetical protein [Egibacteraceae bacterium]
MSEVTKGAPSLDAVLAGAARLQQLVPGAVLVGGSSAAYHAGHRLSYDHDHVVEDLAARYDTVLETLEALDDWSTARLAGGKLILDELGGIETGVRQMIRRRPLEVEEVSLGERVLRVPTLEEILRIKAWLAVTRNRTRDFLDAAALSDRIGIDPAGRVLARMDDFYAEVNRRPEAVATQVARQFADPAPKDPSVTKRLATYKHLNARWHDWAAVVATLREVAVAMVGPDDGMAER